MRTSSAENRRTLAKKTKKALHQRKVHKTRQMRARKKIGERDLGEKRACARGERRRERKAESEGAKGSAKGKREGGAAREAKGSKGSDRGTVKGERKEDWKGNAFCPASSFARPRNPLTCTREAVSSPPLQR